MAICYEDNPVRMAGGFNVPYERQNANRHYLTHYYNLLYLTFIATNSDRFSERAQANKELIICRRKLEHWKRHPNWDAQAVGPDLEKLKRDWSMPGRMNDHQKTS